MIAALVIGGCFLACAVSAVRKGGPWTFRWLYIPSLLLVPHLVSMPLPIFPDLWIASAAGLGLAVGSALLRPRPVAPPFDVLDLLAAGAVISFSVSYGVGTDFHGFVHRLLVLGMEWWLPYRFTRTFVRNRTQLREVLASIGIFAGILGLLSIWEARMADRLALDIWNTFGLGAPHPGHYGHWRWGYLRSFVTFEHPIELGTFFATVAPLAFLWGLVDRKRRRWAWVATGLCVGGCVSGLSRGPLVALVGSAVLFSMLAYRMRGLAVIATLVVVLAAPTVIDTLQSEIASTQDDLEARGNTDSKRYRLALLMLYGRKLGEVGLWGDPSIVGAEYELAWSMDNSYLYFFFVGGWIGGTIFLLLVLRTLRIGIRAIRRCRGRPRKRVAAVVAAFGSLSICMANVWFGPSYAPWFWITAALVLNTTRGRLLEARAPGPNREQVANVSRPQPYPSGVQGAPVQTGGHRGAPAR